MRGALAGLALLGLLASGATSALTVAIDAPEEIKPLLEQHLDAARAARQADPIPESEIARLETASLATARELLATEGYFAPTIDSSRNGEALAFTVVPGTRTTVSRISVTLLEAAVLDPEETARRERLQERVARAVTLAPGMPFRQADWDAAKTAALRPFAGGAYAAARIASSAARIDPDRHSAELDIVVDPGPGFRLGDIRVEGAKRYPADLALHYSPLVPGGRYRQQDLLDYQVALEASGYYASASVGIVPDAAQAGAVPITVALVENPLKLASVGVGVSTNTGARVQGKFQHRNIDGHARRLTLDLKLESVQQQGSVELAFPRDRKGYDQALSVQQRYEDLNGQETRTSVLSARRSRTRGNIETTLATQYQTEAQKIGGSLAARNQALTLNYQWTQRTTGRDFYPARGHVLTLAAGGALDSLLSDTSFLRLYARATRYFQAGESGRFVLRGELGQVLADTRNGIPTDFLFRAGGDNSVRGYAYQSLGRDLAGGTASVRQLATASAEYQYFFNRTWGAAVFADAGDAADSFGALSPAFGVGAGVRWRSPVGPINVDLAYGEAVEKFRVHFSLGVSF